MHEYDLCEIEAQVAKLRASSRTAANEISERDRIIDVLLEKARWSDAVLENAPINICLKSVDNSFIWGNRACSENLGGPVDDVVDKAMDAHQQSDAGMLAVEHDQRVLRTKKPSVQEKIIGDRILQVLKCPVFDAQNNVAAIVGFDTDITALRQVQNQLESQTAGLEDAIAARTEALRQSEKRLRAIAEDSPSPLLITRRGDGTILYANPKVGPLLGLPTEAVEGRNIREFLWQPNEREERLAALESKRSVKEQPLEMRRADGARISTVHSLQGISYAGEDAILGSFEDVTERLRMETALRESEASFRAITESGPLGIVITRRDDGIILYANARAGLMLGSCAAKVFGRDISDFHWDSGSRAGRISALRSHDTVRSQEVIIRRDDGARITALLHYTRFEYAGGEAVLTVFEDITDRKRTEETQRRLLTAIDGIAEIISIYDADDRLVYANQALRDLDHNIADVLRAGATFEDRMRALVTTNTPREAEGREAAWFEERMEKHRHPGEPFEITRRDGITLRLHEQRLLDGSIINIGRDITREITAQAEAGRIRQSFFDALDQAPLLVVYYDEQDRLVHGNAAYRAATQGRSEIGQTYEELLQDALRRGAYPEAAGREGEWLQERLAHHRDPQGSFRVERMGRWYDVLEFRLRDGGSVIFRLDVTEAVEREGYLRRVQRMEAMGTLVGGLAHELNNLLQPIGGLADLALNDLLAEETVTLALQGIRSSSQKADKILQGMLAFGRREQADEDAIDLNEALVDALQVIGPLLPPAIQIDEQIEPGVGRALISGTEFMQVVMNLTKNASDAMEGAGTISLSLACAAAPGDDMPNQPHPNRRRAVLTIADGGPGISEEALNRIFEPFYTTKGVGEGTGLGLAIVYNIVTDWGGGIRARNSATGGAEFEVSIPLE